MKTYKIYVKRELKGYALVSFELFKAGKISREELERRYELIKKEGAVNGGRV
jgi:hypothetical protein